MHLLVFSSEFPPGPGGIGTHAYQLSNALLGLGWRISVYAPQDYAAPAEIRQFNAIQPYPIFQLPSQRGSLTEAFHRWKLLQRVFRQERPDVVLATGGRCAWLTALLTKRRPIPWVAIGHGSEFTVRAFWEKRLTRWAFSQAGAVVCVSQFTAGLMRELRVRPKNIAVIPNGADRARFRSLTNAEWEMFVEQKQLKGKRLLLTVGNVTERKGQEVVIRALPLILKEVPQVHYLMAGLPTIQPKLEGLARELGVADHVHFLGRVPPEDLLGFMNACDLFVMTSRRTETGDCEGFGIAVVEAALCGKPAVVSSNSGLAEAIVHGKTGVAVAEGDSGQTAKTIVELLQDDKRRLDFGRAALDRALSEQTWSTRSLEYDAVLRSLVADSNA